MSLSLYDSYNLYVKDRYKAANDVIAHYGTKGQKWGLRRYQNTDGTYTEEGKARRRKGDGEVDGVAEVAVIATTWALPVAMVAVAAGVQKVKEVKADKRSKEYESERDKAEVDKKTGLGLKSRQMTIGEDAKRVNPEFHKADDNGHTNNCGRCAMAYDMRRRGYDVAAHASLRGCSIDYILKSYKGAKCSEILTNYSAWEKSIRDNAIANGKTTDRGIGLINYRFGGGHAFNYEYRNGKVEVVDSQSCRQMHGNKDKGVSPSKYFSSQASIYAYRYISTQDCKPNFETMKKGEVLRYVGHNTDTIDTEARGTRKNK